VKLVGTWKPSPAGSSAPAVLFLHAFSRERREVAELADELAARGFSTLALAFLAATNVVLMANHLLVQWIALEATTIATAFLVGHHRTPRSLEAAWKYVILGSVGVAIALLGIVLIVSSAACFGTMDTTLRYLGAFIGIALMLWLRFAMHALAMTAWIAAGGVSMPARNAWSCMSRAAAMRSRRKARFFKLSAQAFGSPELMSALSQLDGNLRSLRPGEDWGGSEQFDGEQGVGLGDGTGVGEVLEAEQRVVGIRGRRGRRRR